MKIKLPLRSAVAAVFALGLALANSTRAQLVGINLEGLTLYDSGGNTLSDGKLIQLIASTADLNFSAPTATSFVSGDDVVLASFALDSSILGMPGSFLVPLVIDTSAFPSLTTGDSLLLRWYNIDFVSGQTAPGPAAFGQFRTDGTVDASDMGWFLPGPGASIDLNFVTASNGGSQLELTGFASMATAVPEPASTAAFGALGALVFTYVRRRFRGCRRSG